MTTRPARARAEVSFNVFLIDLLALKRRCQWLAPPSHLADAAAGRWLALDLCVKRAKGMRELSGVYTGTDPRSATASSAARSGCRRSRCATADARQGDRTVVDDRTSAYRCLRGEVPGSLVIRHGMSKITQNVGAAT